MSRRLAIVALVICSFLALVMITGAVVLIGLAFNDGKPANALPAIAPLFLAGVFLTVGIKGVRESEK